jgi:hypothetical protein
VTDAAPAESAAGAVDPVDPVGTVKHRAKRKNIPPAGLEAQGRVEDAPKVRLDYNPHLPPRLRFSDALRRRVRWLDWAGRREWPGTEVEALALCPNSRDRIAAGFVDTDYDSRTLCIRQALFPDRWRCDKLAHTLGDKGVVDESRFNELTGFVTLPFARPPALPPGKPWRVAVKVIDPRGNEGLRVVTMPEPR